MYDKNNIDIEAEREAIALRKQGQNKSQHHVRSKYKKDYNLVNFNKLFRGK